LNAPREGRLGDMSQLSRPAETPRFSQAHKVFKPLGIHACIISQLPLQSWPRSFAAKPTFERIGH
jgi:hypothetical protein